MLWGMVVERIGWGLVVAATAFGCGAPPTTVPQAPAPSTAQSVAPIENTTPLSPKEIASRAEAAVLRIEGDGTLGTGFVVDARGWIATNLHVIVGATKLVATFKDGQRFDVVEVLGFAPDHDVALLRIEGEELPTLPLGGEVSVGDRVVAIGHPLGLSDTVSDGLISAVRQIDESLEVLQISAPIAPGSSGGPLFNERGEVVGIATAILRGGQNLNFGVPIAYLVSLMDDPQPMTLTAFSAATRRPTLPAVEREVPTHAVAMLGGCGEAELKILGTRIAEAVAVGAPLYNTGNIAACYHVYLGASLDMETELSPSCLGPRRALAIARQRAKGSGNANAKAWAMRDGFDGLIEVIERKLAGS